MAESTTQTSQRTGASPTPPTTFACRVCGCGEHRPVVDLGAMPLVNNLLDEPHAEAPRWPLEVVACRRCSLAQLTENVPPDAMFREYCYFSSQSQTMVEHGRHLVERFVRPGQNVVEIASNDGYLLQHARDAGATVLGVDPARNVARFAEERGVPTRCAYFDEETAGALRAEGIRADVMFANNVLAHVPDPNAIARGISVLLADDGVAHIEAPYLGRLLDTGAFDTIYHEHYSYFSLLALRELFNRNELAIVDVDILDIHGGSFHVQVARDGDQSRVDAMCAAERERGFLDDDLYARFAARIADVRDGLLEAIAPFDVVAGYGAAAKSVVMTNAFGLDTDRVAWIADVSPHKQGRFIPGTGQPIVAPERLYDDAPDACVLFAWNIRDEVLRQHAAYRERGGRFVVPIPETEIL